MTGVALELGGPPPGRTARPLDVALVCMPFLPLMMPALGPSILKQVAADLGCRCEVYYGAFEVFRLSGVTDPGEAAVDYSFVSTVEDLGELVFAPVLHPPSRAQVVRCWSAIPTSPYAAFSTDDMMLMVARIARLSERATEVIDRCLAARDWARYDVVGFSTTFSQTVASLCLARRIKEIAPHVRIVFGGANCDGAMGPQLLRSFPWIDHVISGEAEASFAAYLRAVAADSDDFAAVPGLHRRRRGDSADDEPAIVSVPPRVESLAQVPEPDFSDFFVQLPAGLSGVGEVSLPVELSRGCWWGAVQHCVFCGLNPNGMAFRSRAPADALSRLTSAAKRWGVRDIFLVDNILDLSYLDDVLPRLEDSGLRIFCETKSNLKEHQVAQLARAGVVKIQPGIESLNTQTLKHMRKGARGSTQVELLKWCLCYGVRPLWFYLYGFPGERAEWYDTDIALMPRLVHLPPPGNPNPVVVDRHSPLFRDPAAFGLSRLRPAWNWDVVFAGLEPAARANLAYHFDADHTNPVVTRYEQRLWATVAEWRARYRQGAYLVERRAAGTTLVTDGRIPGNVQHVVLTGSAHVLYQSLRTAQPRRTLEALVQQGHDCADLTADDLRLTLEAVGVGAVTVTVAEPCASPDEAAGAVTAFLATLDELSLVVSIDDRWLALSVDASPPPSAAGTLAHTVGLAS